MKNDPDRNSTDSAEIEALITRFERGQLRDEDAQLLARLLRYRKGALGPAREGCFSLILTIFSLMNNRSNP